jgi:DNA-binding XRE family transcriptional regulator
MDFQENFYKLIGIKIAEYRKKKNTSQAALATRVKISRSSVVNIELGRQHTPPHVLWQISKALNLAIQDIYPTQEEVDSFTLNPSLQTAIKQSTFNDKKQKVLEEFISDI